MLEETEEEEGEVPVLVYNYMKYSADMYYDDSVKIITPYVVKLSVKDEEGEPVPAESFTEPFEISFTYSGLGENKKPQCAIWDNIASNPHIFF